MPRLRHPPARALVFALLSLCASVLIAQDGRIRSRVELVLVPVTVKGPNGTPATGLTRNAFTITEAGKVQTITSFSIDPVPLSAAIVLDTAITETALTRMKSSFPALLGAFADDDEIAVYRFEKSVEKLVDFTSDHARISTAVEGLSRTTSPMLTTGSGPFSFPGPVINGGPIIPGVQSAGRTTAAPPKDSSGPEPRKPQAPRRFLRAFAVPLHPDRIEALLRRDARHRGQHRGICIDDQYPWLDIHVPAPCTASRDPLPDSHHCTGPDLAHARAHTTPRESPRAPRCARQLHGEHVCRRLAYSLESAASSRSTPESR